MASVLDGTQLETEPDIPVGPSMFELQRARLSATSSCRDLRRRTYDFTIAKIIVTLIISDTKVFMSSTPNSN